MCCISVVLSFFVEILNHIVVLRFLFFFFKWFKFGKFPVQSTNMFIWLLLNCLCIYLITSKLFKYLNSSPVVFLPWFLGFASQQRADATQHDQCPSAAHVSDHRQLRVHVCIASHHLCDAQVWPRTEGPHVHEQTRHERRHDFLQDRRNFSRCRTNNGDQRKFTFYFVFQLYFW